jgi:hypothetical protein
MAGLLVTGFGDPATPFDQPVPLERPAARRCFTVSWIQQLEVACLGSAGPVPTDVDRP